jgi:hypothetical protein
MGRAQQAQETGQPTAAAGSGQQAPLSRASGTSPAWLLAPYHPLQGLGTNIHPFCSEPNMILSASLTSHSSAQGKVRLVSVP